MVLPSVDVTADTELRWTARAFDPQLSDGYSAYLSCTGDTPELSGDSEIVSEEWYDISGRRVDTPSKGLYIRLSRHSDGTVRSSKVLLSE